jgi:hypothetical protein
MSAIKRFWQTLVALKNKIPALVRQVLWTMLLFGFGAHDVATGHLIRGPYFFFMCGLDLQQFLDGRHFAAVWKLCDEWRSMAERTRAVNDDLHRTVMALLERPAK